MATWALAWCLQDPAVTCVIPGRKNVEQVEANARAAEHDRGMPDTANAWGDRFRVETAAGFPDSSNRPREQARQTPVHEIEHEQGPAA